MLKLLHKFSELDISQVLNVYMESVELDNRKVGGETTRHSMLEDLSIFLSERNNALCVWEHAGRYVSCVRLEQYEDGILLTCLETTPGERRRKHAFSLLLSVLSLMKEQNLLPAYVHIKNNNVASIALHKKLGFTVSADYARLVDGTVSRQYCTMKFE